MSFRRRVLTAFCAAAASLSLLAGVVGSNNAAACAACGNPSLPQQPSGSGLLERGDMQLSVWTQTATLQVSHPAGCVDVANCSEATIQPLHSHELFVMPVELAADFRWVFVDRFALELTLPMRMVHLRAHYETPDGQQFQPLDAGVHHRDETMFGIGDAALGVRGALLAGRWWLTLMPGFSVPTGRTEPDPFALGDAGERHQHIQFGSGTLDPTLKFDATRGLPRSQISFYAMGRTALYENRHGFQAGPRGTLGASIGYKAPRVLATFITEGAFEGADRWSGVIRQDGLIGSQEYRVGAQLIGRVGSTTLSGGIRVPLYRHLIEGDDPPGTLRSPLSVMLGASWALNP